MNRFIDFKSKTAQPGFAIQTPDSEMFSELPLSVPGCEKTQTKSGFYQRQLLARLANLKNANVDVVDLQNGFSRKNIGDAATSDLAANVFVAKEQFYKRIVFGGTIGSAESYIDGDWVSDDLTSLIRIMIRNLERFSKLEKSWAWLKNTWHFLQHRTRKNSIVGSRKNIHEHYDLGNEFYRLFLDPTMNYSSGIFESPDADAGDSAKMHDASIRKMDLICQKLQLGPQDHVLEIGAGWGGLAMHMAQNCGCRVTTTTISKEQLKLAQERVAAAGLADRVTVLLKDYRELEGRFDKIVSIEMIEAVGHQYYDEYFSRCSNLLADDGLMLIQSITIGEQDYDYHIRHVDFIRKYVFPGGCLPSISALASSVGRSTDMRMLHQEDITPHYVKTLAYWRSEFMSKLDEVKSLGYDDSFIRLWHFYLCYCEAAFAERRVHNVHLMFAKPKCESDPATAPDSSQP